MARRFFPRLDSGHDHPPPTAAMTEGGSKVNENKEKAAELADKPGSVVDSHSSGRLRHRSAQATYPDLARAAPWGPYLVLLQVGFAVPVRCRTRGALLPHHFTLACTVKGDHPVHRRYLSVALSVGSRRPGVTWHLALWSPDFPRHALGQQEKKFRRMTRLSGQLRRAHYATSHPADYGQPAQ